MNFLNLKNDDNQYIANTYSRFDVCITGGKNATAYDINNSEYIDFTSGIGVNSLGFCDEEYVDVIVNQAKTLSHISNLYYTTPCTQLAKKLCISTGYSKVFFANSGAEANEGAIKTARKYSFDKYGENRNKIISLVNSFHGRTITTLSATGQESFHNFFFPFTEGFDYAKANDIDDLIAKIDETVCGVMFEFIQGEGGVCPLEKEYIKQVFEICKKHDIILIADEVQTGIGRTGKLLASEHFEVCPDITTLAKGLGNGLPIGAVLLGEKVQDVLTYGTHGTTFGGNPIASAGAEYVLDKINTPEFLAEVEKKAQYIRQKLASIEEIEGIDGIGLMLGIRLKTKNSLEMTKECVANGLLILTAKQKLRMLPPLTITYQEIDKGLEILQKVLGEN
jgi:acetylornithine/N-succinyldiaminopimelate aminotransferase